MAYTDIEIFEHGDFPLAADLNKIIDNQEFFNETIYPHVFGAKGGSRLIFIYRYRFLWFQGTSGTIENFPDQDESVSISDDDGDFAQYDLNTISWLSPGQIFLVNNCDYAINTPV